jgi:hypothetical protein
MPEFELRHLGQLARMLLPYRLRLTGSPIIIIIIIINNNKTLHSVALVRQQTIPIEQQALVGEESANFCG